MMIWQHFSKHQSASLTIEPATLADLPAMLTLLTKNGLPPEGVEDCLATALLARAGDELAGCAALEPYGPAALLRSVAVAERYRERGLGQRLTRTAIALARRRGFSAVYLLTETAAGFFPRFGFLPVDRALVPPSIQGSLEFTTLCPDSALVMKLNLQEAARV